jgi:hypothetical protein
MGTLPSMGSCDMALSEKDSAGVAVGHSAQLIEARLQQENVALREEVDKRRCSRDCRRRAGTEGLALASTPRF